MKLAGKFYLITLLVIISHTSFGQTPVSADDLPQSEVENIAGISNEEMIVFLNKRLKPEVANNKENHLETFVLMGGFVDGKIVIVDLGTLGVKVDPKITSTITQTMKKHYSKFLSRKGKIIDHEFNYVFNFDLGLNQVSTMSVSTMSLRKNWQAKYEYLKK